MKFIRLRTYKVINEGTSRWSLIAYLKMVVGNLKSIFTRELMANGNKSFIVEGREEETVFDKVLTENGLVDNILMDEDKIGIEISLIHPRH